MFDQETQAQRNERFFAAIEEAHAAGMTVDEIVSFIAGIVGTPDKEKSEILAGMLRSRFTVVEGSRR